jgi:hypothetical protein
MQAGHSLPLNLAPEQSLEQRRPQTPKPPFPYTINDTTFTAPDGAVMCATLTLPPEAAQRKVPAVIMVTGSGAQNRDEELFEHKPFAVIADYLARHGIACATMTAARASRAAFSSTARHIPLKMMPKAHCGSCAPCR